MAQDITGMDRHSQQSRPAVGLSCLIYAEVNAVMDRLPETLLKQLADHSPPVIVCDWLSD